MLIIVQSRGISHSSDTHFTNMILFYFNFCRQVSKGSLLSVGEAILFNNHNNTSVRSIRRISKAGTEVVEVEMILVIKDHHTLKTTLASNSNVVVLVAATITTTTTAKAKITVQTNIITDATVIIIMGINTTVTVVSTAITTIMATA